MDDPSLDWKIQKFPSKDSNSKVSLMLNKGWSLGKKVVITGMAISSAPFVIPPLLIFSALGFAFSVPFGLVFAGYACTQKIMSKFLSIPIPPPMLKNEEGKYRGEMEEERRFEENEDKPIGESNGIAGKMVEEEKKPMAEMRGGRFGDIVAEEDRGVEKEKEIKDETVPSIAENAREQTPEGKKRSSDSISKGSADSVEHPVSSGIPESTLGLASQKEISVPSKEVLYTEVKVWEKIDTIRMIVGYKAPRLMTCTDELKALYAYTGVEPPASLKDPSDLVEVSYKLRFLMSVVGVK